MELPALICKNCNGAIFAASAVRKFEDARVRFLAAEGANDERALTK